MYMAWLCYPHTYDLESDKPEIKFEQPESWKYSKIIPIQFSVLHTWTDKDKGLYK
jgi:hypothetical protein